MGQCTSKEAEKIALQAQLANAEGRERLLAAEKAKAELSLQNAQRDIEEERAAIIREKRAYAEAEAARRVAEEQEYYENLLDDEEDRHKTEVMKLRIELEREASEKVRAARLVAARGRHDDGSEGLSPYGSKDASGNVNVGLIDGIEDSRPIRPYAIQATMDDAERLLLDALQTRGPGWSSRGDVITTILEGPNGARIKRFFLVNDLPEDPRHGVLDRLRKFEEEEAANSHRRIQLYRPNGPISHDTCYYRLRPTKLQSAAARRAASSGQRTNEASDSANRRLFDRSGDGANQSPGESSGSGRRRLTAPRPVPDSPATPASLRFERREFGRTRSDDYENAQEGSHAY